MVVMIFFGFEWYGHDIFFFFEFVCISQYGPSEYNEAG